MVLWFKRLNKLKGMRNTLKLSVQTGISEPAIGVEKWFFMWHMGGEQVSSQARKPVFKLKKQTILMCKFLTCHFWRGNNQQ